MWCEMGNLHTKLEEFLEKVNEKSVTGFPYRGHSQAKMNRERKFSGKDLSAEFDEWMTNIQSLQVDNIQ